MKVFPAMTLPEMHDVIAPDGSEVRVLLALGGGGMAHFRLPAAQVSQAVRHRTVGEIWFVLSGHGEMWRSAGARDHVTRLTPGTCLAIEAGTCFQFRSGADEPLAAVAVTMPPWPGDEEAEYVEGIWQPTSPNPAGSRGTARPDR